MRLPENVQWARENFAECELRHAARSKRLVTMAVNMLENPDQSLPRQNVEWSDLKGAYRLCDRPEATFDAVAGVHWNKVRQTKPGVHLLISDTTDINHYSHPATKGLGMLGDGQGRGMQVHSCLVVNAADHVVEGIAGAKVFSRRRSPQHETRAQRLARSRESDLWGDLVDQVGESPPDSQWVHVFDRGGDNFDALCHIVRQRCDFVIRAAKLNRNVLTKADETLPLKEALEQAETLGTYDLHLRSRPGQAARVASLTVSRLRVKFPLPVNRSPFVKSCGITEIAVNVVSVEERHPPKGVTPIRWVLLTSLPVTTLDEAWTVIEYYECRWLIEEYHKVLKTGCSIERHALRTAGRLKALMGLISVVGVRLLQLKTISRHEPSAKARHRVPTIWLDALRHLRPKLAGRDPTIYEFFRELAKLGGFLGRKHDGEPGWQTIWFGYQRLQSFIQGMTFAIK